MSKRIHNGRIVFIFFLFSLFWIALVVRSAHLQIIPDEKLANLQKRQYRTLIEIPPRRGNIVDRNGKELAVTIPAYSLYADPKIIEDSRLWSKKVAKITGLRWVDIFKKVKDKSRRFVWIKKRLSKDQKEAIAAMGMRGHGFVEEGQRIYPNDGLMGPVLGFLGSEGKGLEGLERAFDSYLRGEKRVLKISRDARGRPLLAEGKVFTEMPAGSDIELTIDSNLQFIVEKALAETVTTFNADSAMGIVMDAKTSEILSLAMAPTYDNNRPFQYSRERWRNKLVTDIYEPGSVMKTILIAGALRAGIVRPNTTIDCENGRMRIGKRIIREADSSHNFKELSVTEVLAKSSNVGTAKIAFRMGSEEVRETLTDFGFGQETELGLPGEVGGILHKLPWNQHLLANISFGQGVAVTPLQVINSYAAIANGGELRQPLLIKKIQNLETGERVEFTSERIRRVLSSEEASTMRLMLSQVTARGHSGYHARVPGFTVAGKTGTAQKIDSNGTYKSGLYIASFVGMIPAHDPKFVILVTIDNPRDKYYGSEVAAPLFSRIAGYAVRQAGLAPNYVTEKSLVKREERPLQKQAVKEIRAIASDMKSSAGNKVPDFRGLSLREVIKRSRNLPIQLEVQGTGQVAKTKPAAHEELPASKKITVYLE